MLETVETVTSVAQLCNSIYASPSSGEAYRDRQLTTNFRMRIPKHCLSVHLSVPREKKSPWLRQYQSYISNWCINGKVFTSTTPRKPKNLNFFASKKFEIDKIKFCPYPEKRNRPGFIDISPTLLIDTSMERSSRILEYGNPKIRFFFFLNVKLNFWLVYFDSCQRAKIV